MSNIPIDPTVKELNDQPTMFDIRLLNQLHKRPTLLRGIFTELTRQFYLNEDNFPLGTPTKVWSPEPTETDIWIDTELAWEDETPEFRPAIYIKLSPIVYSSLTGRKDGLMGGDPTDSEEYFSRTGKGNVSFVHIAELAGEAESLCDATSEYLDVFGAVIRNDFCFTHFHITNRIPLRIGPKESKTKRYESVVTCNFEFQDTWTVKLEAQKLKKLVFRAGQNVVSSGIV